MNDVRNYELFINGRWELSASRDEFEVYNPYTREVFARVANGGKADAVRAIAAADAAFEAWADILPAQRAELLMNAAAIWRRRRHEFAEMLAAETGCATMISHVQQDAVIRSLEAAAAWVYHPRGQVYPSDVPGQFSMSVRRPLGVIACFSPWNGANLLGWRAALYPLVAGNTVVVKPSELSPVSAGLVIAQVAEEAGFPAGVVNVIPHAPGKAQEIADAFFEAPAVRGVNLIGGVKTARILAERAGRTLKRTTLELGGYNPMIVLDDADVDYAARTAMFGSFIHQGQVCSNTRKVIVQRSIYDAFVEKFIFYTKMMKPGDPRDPTTMVGPLITPAALANVQKAVKEALDGGAKMHTGGTSEGQIYMPTILTDVPEAAALSCEETFGPVTVVVAVDTAEEALAVANSGNYGLVASIVTGDSYRGFKMAPKIMAGVVHVNSPTVSDETHVPMGGVRDSGWGRSGPDSVNDFTDVIWITSRNDERPYPI